MSALLVYESMFGNTKAVAEAIAEGLAFTGSVRSVEVGDAPTALSDDVTLVVVGGPTHAFGLSRARTRDDAGRSATQPLISAGIGVREWLAALDPSSTGVRAAAFDTRVSRPRLPGSAARGIGRRLRRKGYQATESASFYVDGTTGPLVAGEIERARRWGQHLGSIVAGHAPSAG